jgi:hypothetical protein
LTIFKMEIFLDKIWMFHEIELQEKKILQNLKF